MTLENIVNTVADHKDRLTGLGNVIGNTIYDFAVHNPGAMTPAKIGQLGNNLSGALTQYSSQKGAPLDGFTPEFVNVALGAIFGVNLNTIKNFVPEALMPQMINQALGKFIELTNKSIERIASENATPLDTIGASEYIAQFNAQLGTNFNTTVPEGDTNYVIRNAIELGNAQYLANITPNN